MDLIINFVWVGTKKLGWLELFMIYSWRMWNCKVDLYTHSGPDAEDHDCESLGLPPNICRIFDLSDMVERDDDSFEMGMDDVEQAQPLRNVLSAWFKNRVRPWGDGGQTQIFNMVDLAKSYIAMTRTGIVLDMKIGPSAHIKKYVDKKVFENHFVSYIRAGTIENQCMGTMRLDSSFRLEYGRLFIKRVLPSRLEEAKKIKAPYDVWFGDITSGHINACTFGKRLHKLLDIGVHGKADHIKKHQLANAAVQGIADEEFYGPLRIFKRESDQTNRSGGKTTDEDRLKIQRVAFLEIAQASSLVPGDGGAVDIYADGMSPIENMLELLKLTKPS